jgi:phytoene/squalene synthetase
MVEAASRNHPMSDCADQVREHDPDRYLAALFAPATARRALFALYAFDHEIAKVRAMSSASRSPAWSACSGGATRSTASRQANPWPSR